MDWKLDGRSRDYSAAPPDLPLPSFRVGVSWEPVQSMHRNSLILLLLKTEF